MFVFRKIWRAFFWCFEICPFTLLPTKLYSFSLVSTALYQAGLSAFFQRTITKVKFQPIERKISRDWFPGDYYSHVSKNNKNENSRSSQKRRVVVLVCTYARTEQIRRTINCMGEVQYILHLKINIDTIFWIFFYNCNTNHFCGT